MATYYVDPAAAGTNAGTSWTNAWTTLQRAIDGTGGTKPVAGDVVLCRGTETVAAVIDSDGNSGSDAAGYVTFRGVNASGTNDGTRYLLDAANNTLTSIIRMVADRVCFENMELKRCTGDGFRSAAYDASDSCLLVNCYSHTNTGNGYNNNTLSGSRFTRFIRCRFESNGAYGIDETSNFICIHCVFKSNTSGGVRGPGQEAVGNCFIGCVFTANGGNGCTVDNGSSTMFYECVFDGNTTDGLQTDIESVIYGCRFTENTNGIDNNKLCVVAHCYMPAAGQGRDNSTATIDVAGATYYDPLLAGAATNNLAGTDANGGYTSPATDLTLTSTATLRNQTIPLDGTMNVYVAAGLSPTSAVSAGGGVIIPNGFNGGFRG